MKHEENYTESIHNENYYEPYNLRNINADSLIFIEGRQTEKLNGSWHYVEDLYDVGFRDSWHRIRGKTEKGLSEPWDFHPDEGELTILPNCWNTIDPGLFYFEGSVWYSRKFEYEPRIEEERIFLRIGAANYDTKIFLNGVFLGNHVGGSTPFFIELGPHVKKENRLLISVNNARTSDRVPMKNTDWYNWGGIYRDIELVRLPKIFIKTFRAYLVPNNSFDTLRFECGLSEEIDGVAHLKIADLNIDEKIVINGGKGHLEVHATPELWEPVNPKLYEISLEFEADRVHDQVGFRQIEVKKNTIYLNGKQIFLHGISVHEDDTKNGKFLSPEDLNQRFTHARELNANFMRLAHYPHDERVAKKADREGILLWSEIPVYWAIDFSNSKTYADAENQLKELIIRDFNRASIIIWSVGNENADSDARLRFMSNLAKEAKTTDPTRLVSAACLVNHQKNKIEDRLTEYLDVIGLNEYFGWYEPNFNDLITLIANSTPKKPVFISEFGAGAKAGHHGTVNDIFTEEYMDEIYRKQIEVIRDLDYICGMSPWILYDFTCPRRKNRFQRGYNRKGLIAEDKVTKKLAFHRLKAFYSEFQ